MILKYDLVKSCRCLTRDKILLYIEVTKKRMNKKSVSPNQGKIGKQRILHYDENGFKTEIQRHRLFI